MTELLLQNEKELEEWEDDDFVSLLSDTTFKYLYKNIDTREWLNNIIKEVFLLDITNYQLTDNESNTGNKIKDYRVDLKLINDNNTIIIEMNKKYYNFLDSKNYQYLYREAGSLYDTGEKYKDRKTKLISFNNYRNKELPYLKMGNYIFEDPKTKLRIEDIESFEIYLPNYKKVCYDSSELEVSLSLFSARSFDEMRKLTKNPKDIKIIEELERLAMDEEFKLHYNAEAVRRKTENSIKIESYQQGLEEGVSQGLEQGLEQGSKQEKIEIAKNMLKKDMDISTISELTGLDITTLKELSESV